MTPWFGAVHDRRSPIIYGDVGGFFWHRFYELATWLDPAVDKPSGSTIGAATGPNSKLIAIVNAISSL
jgi:hypothetical protein